WRGFPFFGISFLAGMKAIPAEMYEAAAVDGATALQRFRHVTLPALQNIIIIVVLLSTIWTFNDFTIIYILTKGGPGGATQVEPGGAGQLPPAPRQDRLRGLVRQQHRRRPQQHVRGHRDRDPRRLRAGAPQVLRPRVHGERHAHHVPRAAVDPLHPALRADPE